MGTNGGVSDPVPLGKPCPSVFKGELGALSNSHLAHTEAVLHVPPLCIAHWAVLSFLTKMQPECQLLDRCSMLCRTALSRCCGTDWLRKPGPHRNHYGVTKQKRALQIYQQGTHPLYAPSLQANLAVLNCLVELSVEMTLHSFLLHFICSSLFFGMVMT